MTRGETSKFLELIEEAGDLVATVGANISVRSIPL